MRNFKIAFTVIFLLISTVTEASDQGLFNEEFHLARAALMDASIRADTLGIWQSRARFEALLKDDSLTMKNEVTATISYYIGFADFQLYFAEPELRLESSQHLRRALEHLNTAIELKADLLDAHLISAMCSMFLSFSDRQNTQDHLANMNAAIEEAKSISPGHPHLAYVQSFQTLFSNRTASTNHALRAVEYYEGRQGTETSLPDWWNVAPYSMLTGIYIYDGELEKATAMIEKALALRPDYEFVRSNWIPAVKIKQPLSARQFDRFKWIRLAADKNGDGNNPQLPDAKALHYYYDQKNDSLWFKIDLHKQPDLNAFGINLVADVDGNPKNGAFWWGGNNSFWFDKLATVWVTRNPNGSYMGIVGFCKAGHALKSRMTRLGANNIHFGFDEDDVSFVFGFSRFEFDSSNDWQVIAAVGSNLTWNDDIVDSGSCLIDLGKTATKE